MPNGTVRRQECDLYLPGHHWHWIQARKASETTPRIGKVVDVGDGVITVKYLDRTSRYRNHDARTLAKIAKPGMKVRVFERYGLLGVENDHFSGHRFCVVDAAEPLVPCSYEPLVSVTPEALAERLRTRGGFSVPGDALIRAVHTDDGIGESSTTHDLPNLGSDPS